MNSVENMLFRKTKEQAYREVKAVNNMENAMRNKFKKYEVGYTGASLIKKAEAKQEE